jgi:hypothetical protein
MLWQKLHVASPVIMAVLLNGYIGDWEVNQDVRHSVNSWGEPLFLRTESYVTMRH